ncbi:hypothetical protein H0X32_02215 [Patescibacteria group bacterium]|nr:hypothetical protein [Patescibacteria group bacterium]
MKNKLIFYFFAWLLLLFVVIGAYVMWYNAVGAESIQILKVSSEIKAKTQDSVRLALAKSQLASLSSEESTIEQYFVSTNDVVPFLTQLETTGRSLGTEVRVVSVSATPGTPYGHLSVSLQITGSFNAVLRTLGAIEYEPYDTGITSLTFSTTPATGDATSSSPVWSASAVFSVGTEDKPAVATPLLLPKSTASSTATTSATTTAL